MRASGRWVWRFVLKNAVVWLLMVALLVVVPEILFRWLPLTFARAIGWAVAFGMWTVVVEAEWRARLGAFSRFLLQLILWVAAAILASWASDQLHV
ncbi:MAG TPA: hypothetical protein VGJ29_06335 [Vicinamibacterales bacterium]|jgi:hypothetical protein